MKIILLLRTLHMLLTRQHQQVNRGSDQSQEFSRSESLLTSSDEKHHEFSCQQLNRIWNTKDFFLKYVVKDQTQIPFQISKLIRSLLPFWIIMILVTVFTMGALLSQPFFIRYLRENLTNTGIPSIIFTVLAYKIITSFLFVVSDYLSMSLGVRMYTLAIINVISNAGTPNRGRINCNGTLLTVLEDDCERLVNLPYASTNTIIKILELVVLCTLILNRINSWKIPILASYIGFISIVMILAYLSLKVSAKMMRYKQNRLDFDNKSKEELKQERSKEIKSVTYLMIIDGIGLTIPWLLNTFLTIFIYGLQDLSKSDRLWIITLFSLLRISISGLGYNMNLLGQIRTSLIRIGKFMQSSGSTSSFQGPNRNVMNDSNKKIEIGRFSRTIWNTFVVISKFLPHFKPIFALLVLFCFTNYYCYSQTLKNIIHGTSVFTSFNLTVLVLQFLLPILIFLTLCRLSLRISSYIYDKILTPNNCSINQKFTCEELNRLSGDIRLLDRHFYFFSFATTNHFLSISASLAFSVVNLNSIAIVISMAILMFVIAGGLSYLFGKFMELRKCIYREEAMSKGKLLGQLMSDGKWREKCMEIYEFKLLGYAIEMTFIGLVYLIMAIVAALLISLILLLNDSDIASVIIMMVIQLDSQFLMVFIQRIQLEINIAAINRCLNLVNKNSPSLSP